MKVLMVVSWYGSREEEVLQAGVFHYEQAMALKKYCDTALYFPFDTALNCEFSAQEENGLLTYRRRLRRSGIPKLEGAREILRIVADLKRICQEFQPDILHAHCAMPVGRAVALFGKLYGYPVVITEHNPLEMLRLESPWIRWMTHLAYRMSDANICVSGDSMARLKRIFNDVEYRIIYNGIRDPGAVGSDGVRYARPGVVNCSIVAAFYSKDVKGYQYLLPAIQRLKEEGVAILLHICGGGQYQEYFESMARELGIEDCCVFYGSCSREKVYSVLSQMDFSISASIYESAGVSVEEALLMGKPLLVTRSGGANSLVSPETAIVVDRGSAGALAEGIREMIRRKDEFRSETIRDYAFRNFEIDQVSQQHMQLYRKVLEERNG